MTSTAHVQTNTNYPMTFSNVCTCQSTHLTSKKRTRNGGGAPPRGRRNQDRTPQTERVCADHPSGSEGHLERSTVMGVAQNMHVHACQQV